MLKSLRSHSAIATIDLETVRETLLYMKDDLRRDPALARAADAIEAALAEIDRAQRSTSAAPPSSVNGFARFLPRSL